MTNVLFVVIDDLGYNDIGASDAITPNLEAFRDNSFYLSDHHSAGASCTPSRCSILAALYPHRFGLQENIVPGDLGGIPDTIATLARHLEANGFDSIQIGKWMLGYDTEEHRPLGAGFGAFRGFLHGTELANPGRTYNNPWLKKNELVPPQSPTQHTGHLTEILTDYTIQKMAAFTEPWFISLWHYSCHAPHQAPSSWEAQFPDTERGHFLANLAHLDEQIGRMLEEVPEDTIVIITSDNGGESQFHPNGQGWRGHKGTPYEAGHRIPCMVQGPGITAGERTFLSSHLDFLPTLSGILGLSVPVCDGCDYSDAWLGGSDPSARRLHWEMAHESGTGIAWGQRRQNFKMVAHQTGPSITEDSVIEFYDLNLDPMETTDVSSTYPEKIATFLEKQETWHDDVTPTP